MRRTALLLMSILVGACLVLTGCQSAFAPEAEIGPLVDAYGSPRALSTSQGNTANAAILAAASDSTADWAYRADQRGLVGTAPSLGEEHRQSWTTTTVYDNTYASGGKVRDRYTERRVTRTRTYSDGGY